MHTALSFHAAMAESENEQLDKLETEKLEISIQKKRECFNNAKKVIERLMEEDVTEILLLESVKHITQSDYQDVVEERSIIKLCGYAVCKNKLKNIPAKKYQISTASNKIYDITERKNFCSNRCYKASLFLKEQMLVSPEWLQDNIEMPAIHLLPNCDQGGCLGEEIVLGLAKITVNEPKPTEIVHVDNLSSFAVSTLEELQQIGGYCYESLLIKEQTLSKKETPTSNIKLNQEIFFSEDTEFVSELHNIMSKNVTNDINVSNSVDKAVTFEQLPISKVDSQTDCNKQSTSKMTKKTIILAKEIEINSSTELINTESIVKCTELDKSELKLIPKSSIDLNILEKQEVESSEIAQTKYKKINKDDKNTNLLISTKTNTKSLKERPVKEEKLQFNIKHVKEVVREWFTLDTALYLFGIDNLITKLMLQAETFEVNNQSSSRTQSVKNQFIKLCKELEERKHASDINSEEQRKQLTLLELKVKAFYGGKTGNTPETKINEEIIKPVLPEVDRYNQKTIRQKIVLGRLAKVLPEILDIFGITTQDISTEARNLTETFNFGAHNIMLRPTEWNLIGLLLIKMMSEKIPELKETLASKKSVKCLAMMMKSFNLKPDFLEILLSQLCGVDNIILQTSVNQLIPQCTQ